MPHIEATRSASMRALVHRPHVSRKRITPVLRVGGSRHGRCSLMSLFVFRGWIDWPSSGPRTALGAASVPHRATVGGPFGRRNVVNNPATGSRLHHVHQHRLRHTPVKSLGEAPPGRCSGWIAALRRCRGKQHRRTKAVARIRNITAMRFRWEGREEVGKGRGKMG